MVPENLSGCLKLLSVPLHPSIMKKITEYRKLLGVNEAAELQELKTVYRSLMKNWHPDKFQDDAENKLEAEEKSKNIIH